VDGKYGVMHAHLLETFEVFGGLADTVGCEHALPFNADDELGRIAAGS